ncbi:hypothetical protein L873DRAFT_1799121 [Choiromyces venosus 120613-1]|uniref:Uncharacterized protein n=1 Tax=Choiromyces venosus 120613-1 TaxID=1336337 RepID=A0A3N4J6J9_9PEZI|nr:hypothetical protein L873DRAFT_1817865 [Choiromyces venosus 120613-1]RPB04716.1 hypothetical protein L873DRAFT_1799121 [Choiromyces venosus 120613-1]
MNPTKQQIVNRQSDTDIPNKIFAQFGLYIYKCTIGYRFGFSRQSQYKTKIIL